MIMKAHIYLTLICLSSFYSSNAQTEVVGYEKYNSYKLCFYVDNLAQQLIPDVFNSAYYNSKFYKVSLQVIDNIRQKRDVHIRTKKAKDGYLFVNKSIMDKIADLDCDSDKLKISYVYNNKVVTTKEDVMRILGLRKKRIQMPEILQNEQSGVITVYIFDK